jgi:hypothetical protein
MMTKLMLLLLPLMLPMMRMLKLANQLLRLRTVQERVRGQMRAAWIVTTMAAVHGEVEVEVRMTAEAPDLN